MKKIKDIGFYNTIIKVVNGTNEHFETKVSFNDEYDEERDSTPLRKRKLNYDDGLFFIKHKGKRYYLDEKDNEHTKSRFSGGS